MVLKDIISNKRLAPWAFYLWLIIIVIATILPRSYVPELEVVEGEKSYRLDYPLHLTFFIFFGALLYWYRIYFKSKRLTIRFFGIMVIGILIAFADEWIQIIIPSRRFNIIDAYSNIAGTLIGFWAFYYLDRRYNSD